ncbi:hypothetical protein [Streptomyces eurythermus]|uniref:hypothetical protein n=1 Tax=Streptomyces eurythermus TaxID=42237 RepID=UPI0036FB8ADB
MRIPIALLAVTAAPALAVVAVGRWNLHIDRNHVEITARPRPSCPCCHGKGGWWTSGPFPQMEACGCWSDRRTLRIPLRPARRVEPWTDEPPF